MGSFEDDALLPTPPLDIEKQWLVQAVRRAAEIDQGMVKLIPADQVMQQALDLCRSLPLAVAKFGDCS